MKTINGIFVKIASVENIEASVCEAANGKRRKRSVRYALKNRAVIARRLHEQLTNGTWRPPEKHHAHPIGDGVTSKKRVVVCPEFIREQVVHHAILRVLAPLITRRFDRWSCGSVPGRGQEDIARMLKRRMRKNPRRFKYFAKEDVSKFFDSIDTEALKAAIRRIISDRRVLDLIDLIIDGNAVEDGCGNVRRTGVPIGFFTSPWFANIALDGMDKVVRSNHIHVFARFMDDFVMFSANKRDLMRALRAAEEVISEFGLRFKFQKAYFRFGDEWANGVRMTSFAICRKGMELRDRIYLRARRRGSRILRKIRNHKRVTATDAGAIISYAGKFRAFGAYRAFVKDVLKDNKIKFGTLRRLVSFRAKKERQVA